MAELLFSKTMDTVWQFSGDKMVEKMKALDLESQLDQARCKLGSGPAMHAGAKVGPETKEEYIKEIAPDVLKAIMESAAGGAPLGMVLSIPGMTQVQYSYKGLANGPEKRQFFLKGRLTPSPQGPRLLLELDGDVQGDKMLTIEYQVNYQTDRATFPAWSPFRQTGARVMPSGTIALREHQQVMKTQTFRDQATGKTLTAAIPVWVTKAREVQSNIPFATFDESGFQRDNVTPWHEYQYYWTAFKVTGLNKSPPAQRQ